MRGKGLQRRAIAFRVRDQFEFSHKRIGCGGMTNSRKVADAVHFKHKRNALDGRTMVLVVTMGRIEAMCPSHCNRSRRGFLAWVVGCGSWVVGWEGGPE